MFFHLFSYRFVSVPYTLQNVIKMALVREMSFVPVI
jgi:hypothetical protein